MSSKKADRLSSVRSRTSGALVYRDYRDNFVIWPGREAALDAFVKQSYKGLGQHKLRHTRSSNSEDALTWSCFDTLSCLSERTRADALERLWTLAFSEKQVPPGLLGAKISVGKQYGEKGDKTEVDASIEGDGLLVFIEAKLYSSMSAADPDNGKPHNQIEKKLRVGLREAAKCGGTFYFILLDIAPLEALRALNAGATLDQAKKPGTTGFSGKWTTAYWFARYRHGSRGSLAPLQKLLADAGFPETRAEDVAKRMGWLTWADVFKAVLRATIPESQ